MARSEAAKRPIFNEVAGEKMRTAIKMKLTAAGLLSICAAAVAAPGTFTDNRDAKTYKTTTIGERTWMAENLNYRTDSSWCYADSNSYCGQYGRLYSWNAAMSACPSGWHLPFGWEWDTLALEAGGAAPKTSTDKSSNTWRDVGKILKAKNGWKKWRHTSGNGTDDVGFSALPGGHRVFAGGAYNNAGYYGYWWTNAKLNKNNAFARTMDYDSGHLFNEMGNIRYGYSVRCIKDEDPEKIQRKKDEEQRKKDEAQRMIDEERARIDKLSTYFTDSRDGRKYRAVKIGDKTWMAENLNFRPKTWGNTWCYDNDTSNCDKYGRLYDWSTAKKVCPPKWHLPSRGEWAELGKAVGSERRTFNNGTVDWYGAGRKLKSKTDWKNDYSGTDNYGFSALPAGGRSIADDAEFAFIGEYGEWWTASGRSVSDAYRHSVGHNYDSRGEYDLMEYYLNKDVGLSVRCVADK